MAHFAKLNKENIVEQIIVINDEVLLDENGIEQDHIGIDLCKYLYNYQNFKRTYMDGSIRKNYASIGYTYDENRNAFIPPKPFDSWTLNENSCLWEAPVAYPNDGQQYEWNEETTSWNLITE